MAQLPVYRQQGNITTQTPGQVRDLNTFAQSAISMQKAGNMLYELTAKWQESKDAVENLDGKNKLNSGISEILNEAANFNDYSTPEELSQKQNELTQRMNELVPGIVSGFSNNQTAREFEANGQFETQQNIYKLQAIFRDKYGDMYNANLMQAGDSALKSFTLTGDENYKKEYFDAIEVGRKAGYISNAQAEKLKLSTDEWNYDYVYSKTLENPYFKASDEIMSKIDPVKQRTLRNFARAEQKRAQAEAAQNALNSFCLNPTAKNLKNYYKHNPRAKGSKDLENILNTPVDFNTPATYDGMKEALSHVKNLAVMDVSTPENKQAYMAAAAKVGWAIKKSNRLDPKEKEKLFTLIYKDMMNDDFKNKLKNMPDLSKQWSAEFNRDYQKLQGEVLKADIERQKFIKAGDMSSEAYKKADANYQKAWRARHYYMGFNDAANKDRAYNAPLGVINKMKDYQRDASKAMLNAYMAGNIQEANRIKEDLGQQMVRLKYWNIPALQKQNLKIGDKFTVNGKVYSYQGFSKNDVIVEVH